MASSSGRDVANLRLVTQRLASTSAKQLPIVIPQLAKSLLDSKTVLSTSESLAKDAPAAVLVHKLTTQITTLLNDQKRQSRWAGVILIKTTIELGDHGVLSKSSAWIRGLLNILGKPDAPSTKQLSIITLTRLFMLTQRYPTLTRQITTPSLPPFITACLNLISHKSTPLPTSLLSTILESFGHLLPDHPSIFRSFTSKIQEIIAPMVAPACDLQQPEQATSDPAVVDAARSLFAKLHFCAQKSGSSAEYSKTVIALLEEIHAVVSQVFRAVHEDWRSSASVEVTKGPVDGDPRQSTSELALPNWSGTYAGSMRLQGLIALLRKFLEIKTTQAVSIPLGSMADLCARVCMVTVPAAKGSSLELSNNRVNELVPKDEREALWSQLPAVHVAIIELMDILCSRLGSAAISLHQTMLEHVSWIFRHEKYNESVRSASYRLVATILQVSAAGMSRDQIQQIVPLLKTCCEDLMPSDSKSSEKGLETTLEAALTNKKTQQQQPDDSPSQNQRPIIDSSIDLLEISLAKVPSEFLSRPLRAQLDRTAILLNDSTAMLASTLNPSVQMPLEKPYSSILPFLARSASDQIEVEGLIRPRLPPVKMISQEVDDIEDESSEDRDMDEQDDKIDLPIESSKLEKESMPSNNDLDSAREAAENPVVLPAHTSSSEALAIANDSNGTQDFVPQEDVSQSEMRPSSNVSIGLKRSTPSPEMEENEAKKPRIDTDVKSSESLGARTVLGTATANTAADDDDDGSDDFVMPELTLEPDTEDEEE